jgi:hypothetical protein
VETLIGASIDKAHYSKAQWKEVTQKLKKGETKQVIDAALLEVQGRRGRKSAYVILEEMLPSEDATILIGEIQKVLSEWKQVDDADIILPYIFAALVKGCLTNEEYNYRTFHAAIRNYADGKDKDFQPEAGNAVAWGIIAKAFEYCLDPTDKKQRKMAAAYLLEKVSWTGISSDFKISLTASRTQQLCDAMTIPKDLMSGLLLAAGGRGTIGVGGGGSTSELTNWDGTKKNTGWGI